MRGVCFLARIARSKWERDTASSSFWIEFLKIFIDFQINENVQGVSKKTQHKVLCSIGFTTQAMSVLLNWEDVIFEAEIHSFILSTEQFLSFIREMRYLAPKFGLAWNSLSPCIFHTTAPNRSSFQRWAWGTSWIFNNMKIYWFMNNFTKQG